jgi:hypothetical protein
MSECLSVLMIKHQTSIVIYNSIIDKSIFMKIHNIKKRKNPPIKVILALIIIPTLILLALYGLSSPADRSVDSYEIDGSYIYSGRMDEKYFQGNGKLTDKKGNIYKGEFSDGKFSGEGTFTSPDGWSYEGTFDNGHPYGAGVLKDKYSEWITEDGKSWTFDGSEELTSDSE